MVLTLKQIAICHNLSDSHSKRASAFSAERRSLLIRRPPGPLLYLAYIFASGNLLAGPFFEFAEFRAFSERSGPFASAFGPGMWRHAMVAAAQCTGMAAASMAVYLVAGMYFEPFMLTEPRVWHLSLAARYAVAFALGARPHGWIETHQN
jgi:hypothetical protein